MKAVVVDRAAAGGLKLTDVTEPVPLPFEDGSFDRAFTGHFYGHLRAGERRRFVAEALRVAEQLVVVDSHVRPDHDAEEEQQRTLNDGSVHRVYKRYFTGAGLAAELAGGEPAPRSATPSPSKRGCRWCGSRASPAPRRSG